MKPNKTVQATGLQPVFRPTTACSGRRFAPPLMLSVS